ncbi:MAG: YdeI/OmpD-associated family protein [Chitinophagaceae bacterium]
MQVTIQKHSNGMHMLRLPADWAPPKSWKSPARVIAQVRKDHQWHAALLHGPTHGYYVLVGKTHMKTLGLRKGAMVELSLKEDKTDYQFNMPESLQEVLDSDPEAAEFFAELTPGNQRGLIYLVSKVKSIDIQIQKALTIAECLKRGVTSPRDIAKVKRS